MPQESKDELTKRVALQIQIGLTAWHELYPDDTDDDACRKSLDLVEFELEDLLTRPDPAVAPATDDSEPLTTDEAVEHPAPAATTEEDEIEELLRPQLKWPTLRQMVLDIARAHPNGFDITTAVREGQAQGWTHPNPRNIVSITAGQLIRAGILVRRDRGVFALSPAFLGQSDDDSDLEE